AVGGMLYATGDKYAEYFDSEASVKEFVDAVNGALIGIGVELITRSGYPAITKIYPDTPAEREGLQAGDLIIAIDGNSTQGRSMDVVTKALAGAAGDKAVLTIQRGENTFTVALQRAEVRIPSVTFELLPGQTGYIALNTFGADTAVAFKSALDNLRGQGAESLIIDLRDNGGGYSYAALDIASNFLPADAVMVIVEDNKGHRKKIQTAGDSTVTDWPIVVLMNTKTASASEVLAGALRDNKLARLVGQVTYGKGVMQTMFSLSNGGALKITTERYFTPAGVNINNTGLIPDYDVLTPELQKGVAWHLLNPQVAPVLSFVPGKAALLDGQETGLAIEPMKVGGREYLPIRSVLESMLYRVHWEQGNIRVIDGKTGQLFYTFSKAGSAANGNIIGSHISYMAVDLCPQFNINITKEQGVYKLERRL
ncbi:MAG: S41 family peptidase, partial [Firmicutes bacterium]|nr:S41 family peptidase [Bacillota bacterium]